MDDGRQEAPGGDHEQDGSPNPLFDTLSTGAGAWARAGDAAIANTMHVVVISLLILSSRRRGRRIRVVVVGNNADARAEVSREQEKIGLDAAPGPYSRAETR